MVHKKETEGSSPEALDFRDEKVDHQKFENIKLESQGVPDIEHALDRKITRKFDLHIVPWLFGLWLLAFIDRSNIGNARIDGLTQDLKLDGNKFNIVSPAQLMDWNVIMIVVSGIDDLLCSIHPDRCA